MVALKGLFCSFYIKEVKTQEGIGHPLRIPGEDTFWPETEPLPFRAVISTTKHGNVSIYVLGYMLSWAALSSVSLNNSCCHRARGGIAAPSSYKGHPFRDYTFWDLFWYVFPWASRVGPGKKILIWKWAWGREVRMETQVNHWSLLQKFSILQTSAFPSNGF